MPPVLECSGLSKTFGGQRALDAVALRVGRGEVHGLLGQNGSGKSTLIKILAGFHAPDPGGRLRVNGEEVALSQAALVAQPISFVHQHLGLVPSLTVLENMLINRLAASRVLRIDWRGEAEAVRAILDEYGVALDLRRSVEGLSQVERALLAIVRASAEVRSARPGGGGLLILDEPTPFLPRRDVERLFAVVRAVVAGGSSVIFVSHDVDEVMEITDRATVLRDGKLAAELVTRQSDREAFISAIVGRKLELAPAARVTERGSDRPARVTLKGLGGTVLDGIALDIAPGEVLGLTGLIGSGYDEAPYLIYGARPGRGRLMLDGRSLDLGQMTPRRAIRQGIVLIPSDRPVAGVIGPLPVSDNATMPRLGGDLGRFRLRRREMRRTTRALIRDYEVRPADPDLPISALSGGNAQKVVLAKWLQMKPSLVLLDEPTQGVDIGARQTVFAQIAGIAATGACVLCASSDYEQLAQICSRVLVFSRGRVATSLAAPRLTKSSIAEAALNAANL